MREVRILPTFESWQAAARTLLREQVPPEELTWNDGTIPQRSLTLHAPPLPATDQPTEFKVPARFVELAKRASANREPNRWALLYKILWRIVHENRELLGMALDADVAALALLCEPSARPFVPQTNSIEELRQASLKCQGCDLYRYATRTVFGQGPADARVMLVGEVPGDQEDLRGAPFVGPAGEVLDRALADVGLRRENLYVTNAVKHFKFERVGKRRIHKTPGPVEVAACRPWVEAELSLLRPEILVCLGATAARSLLGEGFRIMRQHGLWMESPWCPRTIATLHPSAVLRGDDPSMQARNYAMLVQDLGKVAAARQELG